MSGHPGRTLLVVDFPHEGPWGEELARTQHGVAAEIGEMPGLVFKIWTENEEEGRAGGIYCFEDRHSAETYLARHRARLAAMGLTDIHAAFFDVNEPLSRANHAGFIFG